MAVANTAIETSAMKDQHPDLLADIYASTGLMWAHRGQFERSEIFLRKQHKVRAEMIPLDALELSWAEVNLGNVTASTARYVEALEWQQKSLGNRSKSAQEDHTVMKPQGLLYQNIGRAHFLLNHYQEARTWLDNAIKVLSESQNWAMLA